MNKGIFHLCTCTWNHRKENHQSKTFINTINVLYAFGNRLVFMYLSEHYFLAMNDAYNNIHLDE